MASSAISIPDPDEAEVVAINVVKEKLEKLSTDDEPTHFGPDVCICRVPESLRCAKPAAFTPHFVGLGSYHHSDDLIITEKMKFGTSQRAPIPAPDNARILNFCLYDFYERYTYIKLQSFYKNDTEHDYPTLLYQLIVDAKFLWTLLYYPFRFRDIQPQNHFFVITGRTHWRMPLFNSAGEELTMDGIIRDIFMLENQIPMRVLNLINDVMKTYELGPFMDRADLGKFMDHFYEPYVPVYVSVKLTKDAEDYDHLLDFMYHRIVPEPKDCELTPRSFIVDILIWIFIYPLLFIWILPWPFVYLIVVALQPILWLTRSVLLGVIPWFGPLFGQQKVKTLNPFYFMRSVVDLFHVFLAFMVHSLPFPDIVKDFMDDEVGQRIPEWVLEKEPTNSWDEGVVMIPSATELHKAGIRFKNTYFVQWMKLDEARFVLHLPRFKLNVISEVIIANLVAYESLTKSNCLLLTKLVELMRGLMRTTEDVKLLRDAEIIETQLRDEDVVQLLNGIPMCKPVRRPINTRIQKLETGIKNVNAKLDRIENLKWFAIDFARALSVFSTIWVFNPVLVKAFQQVVCSSIYDQSFEFCNRQKVEANGSTYFVSSM